MAAVGGGLRVSRHPRGRHVEFGGLCAMIVIACGHAVSPLGSGRPPNPPRAAYELWCSFVEECAAKTADLATVRWFAVSRATLAADGQDDA